MNNNMSIWEKVCTTRPEHTKAVKFGRKFTAICPQSQRMMATHTFGPFGLGWGVECESFEIVNLEGQQPLLVYKGMFWYFEDHSDGSRCKCDFSIVSSLQMTVWDNKNSRFKLDDDCYKKVVTDALTKGLSFLGFNADVFLGLYDDNRYVESLRNPPPEEKVEKKEVDPEALATQEQIDFLLSKCSENEIELPGEIISQLDEKTIKAVDLRDYWNGLRKEHGI